MTTLSVVLCAHNEAEYLGQQLAALLAQSRQPDELVLLDDGSTDTTGDLLRATPHLNKRCWRYEVPSGVLPAYNRAAQSATSEWIYFASANDVLQPGAFAAWAAQVDSWPGAVLMVGDVAGLPGGWWPGGGYLSPPQLRHRFHRGSIIHGASIFIRRATWEACGGYDPRLEWLADWWLYHSLALRHGLVYLDAPIAAVRALPGALSQGYHDAERLGRVCRRVTERLADPANADIAPAFLDTGLLDIPEAGNGAVKQLLWQAVRHELVRA